MSHAAVLSVPQFCVLANGAHGVMPVAEDLRSDTVMNAKQ